MEKLLERWMALKANYVGREVPDTHSPSAPDTTKFIATHKGNLGIRKDEAVGDYYTRRTYPFVFTVGTAIDVPTQTKIINEAHTMAIEEGYNVEVVYGSAWIGVCIYK